ncbi:hypothetical protein EBME_0182 [bacterium endosymbiont of Mortierella elongata FMR23-6]|nr:hypothetical protein EBME_0182 [bacterium endosymbiont of Mortierella elongata FMR23-6]
MSAHYADRFTGVAEGVFLQKYGKGLPGLRVDLTSEIIIEFSAFFAKAALGPSQASSAPRSA